MILRLATFAAYTMAWAEVFAEAVPTLMEIVDDRFTQYRERSEARKKGREITGGGVGASLAMGRPGPQILKPGPSPAQTIAGPTRTRPDPKKPGPPKQPKLFMNRDQSNSI